MALAEDVKTPPNIHTHTHRNTNFQNSNENPFHFHGAFNKTLTHTFPSPVAMYITLHNKSVAFIGLLFKLGKLNHKRKNK